MDIGRGNLQPSKCDTKSMGQVVRKVDNAFCQINHYPADSVVCLVNLSTG